ncbi:WXG100 family type VII secretion target [Streptomyces sp. NPDC001709]
MGDHHVQPDRYQLERELAQTEIHDADSQCVPHHGRTNFEKHQLNDMIDMVESANPEHLEDAGKALWDARDAINAAADELSAHIGRIDWHGEAANAFHKWASGLVTNAYTLAVYVENAGSHVTAASTGLASVRKSMPPRDTRLMPKSVDDFPMVTQVAGNKDYQAALTVEGHRQEAINQMNRLASYYTVTGESLRDGQAPTFGKMPEMGVPQAAGGQRDSGGQVPVSHAQGAVGVAGTTSHHSFSAPAGPDTAETPDSGKKLHDVVAVQDRHPGPSQPVGTDIDSVNTLPPDTTRPTTPVTPPTAPAPSGVGGGPIPPVPTVPMPPTVGLPMGRGGVGGSRGPVVAPPRMAPPAGGSSRGGGGTGRGPVGPVEEPAGQAGARGPVSPVGKTPVGQAPLGEAPVGRAPVGQAPVGRSVVGGTPRTIGVPPERMGGTGQTGAARTSGVVGGRPTTPPAQAVNGSKVPRGTVVGGETASRNPRVIERPGQRGVIRMPEQESGDGQASRKPVMPTGGVVGTSDGKASTASSRVRASGENVPNRASAVKRGSARDGGRKPSRRQQAPETE